MRASKLSEIRDVYVEVSGWLDGRKNVPSERALRSKVAQLIDKGHSWTVIDKAIEAHMIVTGDYDDMAPAIRWRELTGKSA